MYMYYNGNTLLVNIITKANYAVEKWFSYKGTCHVGIDLYILLRFVSASYSAGLVELCIE